MRGAGELKGELGRRREAPGVTKTPGKKIHVGKKKSTFSASTKWWVKLMLLVLLASITCKAEFLT
jgi:hypothetical protein